MRATDIIIHKRDGQALSAEELQFFIEGYTRGDIPDYQAAAWAMAVYWRGMTPRETAWLTQAMAFSGQTLDIHDVAPFVVDKHSSGGVGDKTSLVVGPLVASLGIPVGKMSGRGLAFSGGTLDKLESIPGWRADLTLDAFKRQLATIGMVIAGQTHDLAPADGKLYALRDVTGTVPALPLIASSIMSKKIASGADAIVLDVKTGSGAFMKTLTDAEALATLMVQIGQELGRHMSAVISDMSQPLGRAVGNALEVKEAIETLHGVGPADFTDLVLSVAAEMVRLADEGAGRRADDARARLEEALRSGAAWRKFRDFVGAQGGEVAAVDDPARLAQAAIVAPCVAPTAGYVTAINTEEVGLTVVDLGGGRAKKGDPIDPAVGLIFQARLGDWVEAGQPLAMVHAQTKAALALAQARLAGAIHLQAEPVSAPPLVHKIIRG